MKFFSKFLWPHLFSTYWLSYSLLSLKKLGIKRIVSVGEGIIVPLDRHFVIYPGSADVDQGAGLDEGDLFYTGSSTSAPPG